MAKKQKLIFLTSTISIFLFVLALTITAIVLNRNEKVKAKPNYDYLVPFENYQMEEFEGDYIYYETINGYLSTNMVYIHTENGKVKDIEKHIIQYTNVLPIDYEILNNVNTLISNKAKEIYGDKFFIEYGQLAYCVIGPDMTPIYFAAAFASDDSGKGTEICINVNNGQYVSYESISSLDY